MLNNFFLEAVRAAVRQRRQQVRKFQRASRKESGIWW